MGHASVAFRLYSAYCVMRISRTHQLPASAVFHRVPTSKLSLIKKTRKQQISTCVPPLACDHSLWLFTSLHSSCSLLPFDADVGRDVHLLRSIQFFSFLLLLMCVILHPKNQINK